VHDGDRIQPATLCGRLVEQLGKRHERDGGVKVRDVGREPAGKQDRRIRKSADEETRAVAVAVGCGAPRERAGQGEPDLRQKCERERGDERAVTA
jgi:hypothetical protein